MRERDVAARRAQLDAASRLSSPSPRQLRSAAEDSNVGGHHVLRHLRMAMPFSPGVTLAERERAIRKLQRDQLSPLGAFTCATCLEMPPAALRVERLPCPWKTLFAFACFVCYFQLSAPTCRDLGVDAGSPLPRSPFSSALLKKGNVRAP